MTTSKTGQHDLMDGLHIDTYTRFTYSSFYPINLFILPATPYPNGIMTRFARGGDTERLLQCMSLIPYEAPRSGISDGLSKPSMI